MGNEIVGRADRHEVVKFVFAVLGASFLVGATIAVPVLPFALGTLLKAVQSLKNSPISEAKVRRTIKSLRERNVISFENKGEEVYVRVNKNWHNKVIQYSIAQLLNFKKDSSWDGEWHAVFFDVPEVQRNKRDRLRSLLKMLGFCRYQHSVYVFPYNCYEEVVLIRQIVEGGSYLKYAVIKQIEGEKELKIYFGLT